MNSGVRIHLEAHGNESGDVPVKIEIFDQSFNSVEQKWVTPKESPEFSLAT
jgi:hypothetical protein